MPYDTLPHINFTHVEGQVVEHNAIHGFGIEFAKQVCQVCSIQCDFVYRKYSALWNAQGIGESLHLYDAASMFTHTYDREDHVEFGDAFTRSRPAGLLARMDMDEMTGRLQPVILPSSDLTNVRVGIIHGYATRYDCIHPKLKLESYFLVYSCELTLYI